MAENESDAAHSDDDTPEQGEDLLADVQSRLQNLSTTEAAKENSPASRISFGERLQHLIFSSLPLINRFYESPPPRNSSAPVEEQTKPTEMPVARSRRTNDVELEQDEGFKSRVVATDHVLPTKEDNVVFIRRGKAKLGYVDRTSSRNQKKIHITMVPSGVRVIRNLDEAYVVDRGFSLGETVVKLGGDGQIGQVIDAQLRADMLILPGKQYVARNVDVAKGEQLELLSASSSHNYVLYDKWIGDAQELCSEVTLVYQAKYRLTILEGGLNGVPLRRRDWQDANRSVVPGEVVSVALEDAMGRKATWEGGEPPLLRRRHGRNRADSIICVVEKVVPHSALFRWLTSPCSLEQPPEILKKEQIEQAYRFDMSANIRAASNDRLRIQTHDDITLITNQEWDAWLNNSFIEKFAAQEGEKTKKGQSRGESSSQKASGPPEKSARVSSGASKDSESGGLEDTDSEGWHTDTEATAGRSSSERAATVPPTTAPTSLARRPPSPLRYPGGRLKRKMKGRVRRLPRRTTPQLDETQRKDVRAVLGDSFLGEILLTHTTCTVEWMDGSIEEGIPGHQLTPIDPDLDQQDHLPGVIVARKDNEQDQHLNEFGIILKTDPKERQTFVRWFRIDSKNSEPVFTRDEQCTLFDIMPHSHYHRMFLGNLGVCVERSSPDMRSAVFQVTKNLQNGKQEGKFFNGETGELWPTQLTQLFVHEEGTLDDEAEDEEDFADFSSSIPALNMEAEMASIANDEREFGLVASPDSCFREGEIRDDVRRWNRHLFGHLEGSQPWEWNTDGSSLTSDEMKFLVLRLNYLLREDFHEEMEQFGYEELQKLRNFREAWLLLAFYLDMKLLSLQNVESKGDEISPKMGATLQLIIEGKSALGDKNRVVKASDVLTTRPKKGGSEASSSQRTPSDPATDVISRRNFWFAWFLKIRTWNMSFLKRLRRCEDDLMHTIGRSEASAPPPIPMSCALWWEGPATVRNFGDADMLFLPDSPGRLRVDMRVVTNSEDLENILGSIRDLCALSHDSEFFDIRGGNVLSLGHSSTTDAENADTSLPEAEDEDETPSVDMEPTVAGPSSTSDADAENKGSFETQAEVSTHSYLSATEDNPSRSFFRAVTKEHKLLREHLPPGIHVVAFENRLDLLSFMIVGPVGTPFEEVPFCFDAKLPALYPSRPPEVHYLAYSQEQLNPNLYQNGKVCTSLLGTWSGQGIETWNPQTSNLQQVFLSIQGLILNVQPYFNEAGYESRKEEGRNDENSRRYNETVAVNSLEYLWRVFADPPTALAAPVRSHVRRVYPGLRERILAIAEGKTTSAYPSLSSTGFRLALSKAIAKIDTVLPKYS